jgi:hypothetical protein
MSGAGQARVGRQRRAEEGKAGQPAAQGTVGDGTEGRQCDVK